MSRFVLDASVVLSWCFPDENSAVGAGGMSPSIQAGRRRAGSLILAAEVLNALLAGEKRKRISGEMIQSFLDDLASASGNARTMPCGNCV